MIRLSHELGLHYHVLLSNTTSQDLGEHSCTESDGTIFLCKVYELGSDYCQNSAYSTAKLRVLAAVISRLAGHMRDSTAVF